MLNWTLMVQLKKWNAFWYSILTCFRFMCSITRYIKNRCGTTVLGNKKHFKLNNYGSDPKCFSTNWAKEEYTEPEQDQVLFHRLFPEWVPCISLHRHYRLSERGIYGELPLPENEISSKQGKRSCDGFPCLCWHWPIFPSRRQPSIFGTAELNFRVRNGNGWTLCVKTPTIVHLYWNEQPILP